MRTLIAMRTPVLLPFLVVDRSSELGGESVGTRRRVGPRGHKSGHKSGHSKGAQFDRRIVLAETAEEIS
jgi:hypothetical protein